MEQKRAKKEDHVKELLTKAEDGIKAVFESEQYKRYLTVMSRFHTYSARNCMLILLQNPDATRVAGYETWQKNFHRQVQRGEKGIAIIGYTPKKVTVQRTKTGEDGSIQLDPQGEPVVETVTRQYPGFSRMYVYDISQTQGEPLPKLVNELQGIVEEYQELLQTLEDVSPYPITFQELSGEAKGVCRYLERQIVIKPGMSEIQTVKTAIHEIAHAFLHDPASDSQQERGAKEVEAESVAYVVCEHYGIDTSDYSFPYLAGWSGSQELKELQQSLDRIQKQAESLISQMDNRLNELRLERQQEHQQEHQQEQTAMMQEGKTPQTTGLEFMTPAVKNAIDSKIDELGFAGCLNFLIETQLNPAATVKLEPSNFRRVIRGELAAEKWEDLTQLFLSWKMEPERGTIPPEQANETAIQESTENAPKQPEAPQFELPIIIDVEDGLSARNFREYVRCMAYPDPLWIEMPEDTNALVTALVNEQKITPWEALEVGRRSEVGLGGRWVSTDEINFQYNDAGQEGYRFPDAANMERLFKAKFPERFQEIVHSEQTQDPLTQETDEKSHVDRSQASEQSGRISMRQRFAEAQKEADRRAEAAKQEQQIHTPELKNRANMQS